MICEIKVPREFSRDIAELVHRWDMHWRATSKYAFDAEKDIQAKELKVTLDKDEAIAQRRKAGEVVEQKNTAKPVAHWMIGFEDFKKGVEPYTLDFVAELSKGDPDEDMEAYKAKLKAQVAGLKTLVEADGKIAYATGGGIALVTLTNPPANGYSYEMMRDLDEVVDLHQVQRLGQVGGARCRQPQRREATGHQEIAQTGAREPGFGLDRDIGAVGVVTWVVPRRRLGRAGVRRRKIVRQQAGLSAPRHASESGRCAPYRRPAAQRAAARGAGQ